VQDELKKQTAKEIRDLIPLLERAAHKIEAERSTIDFDRYATKLTRAVFKFHGDLLAILAPKN
jgi:hypothetical protein